MKNKCNTDEHITVSASSRETTARHQIKHFANFTFSTTSNKISHIDVWDGIGCHLAGAILSS